MLAFRPPFVLLEDRLTGAPARLFEDPVEIVRCDAPEGLIDSLARVDAAQARGLYAAGFLSYEAGYALEPRLARHAPASAGGPLLWFGLFRGPQLVEADDLDATFGGLPPPPPLLETAPGRTRETHIAKVQQVLSWIRAGDIYQANLTFPIRFRCQAPPLALYAAMRARQPVAYGGMVATGEQTVLSVSPELFVERSGGRLRARPMKGTSPRGHDPASDAEAARALAADPKQRAENLMIVDLLRNDLARVSVAGSIEVPELFSVESYPSLHTMTSTVVGRARAGLRLPELMQALFPCGSVVGAPKIRAAEIIAELEAAPRGVYTGAIGQVAPDGELRLNVAIRTATIAADGRGTYGVGGGIVADSDPEAEYDEALLKARVLTDLAEDFGLIETLRWTQAEGFRRLAGHLDRLGRSAGRLGFAFDRSAAEAQLHAAAVTWAQGERRVRAVLARDGALTVSAAEIAQAAICELVVDVASEPLDAADPFLRHKTTKRARHETAFAAAEARGLDEALLLNRAGRIADGSRNSVFLDHEGRLLTPPLRDGALPGVLRAELIAQGRATEASLTPADLRAGQWFLGNSLHGLRPARLA